MKRNILLLIILLLLPLVFAKHGSMPLLAVKQTDSGYEGSTAELFLELKDGTGRVFVDTFPLSKIDTQFSMRFAKEVACDFLNYECGNYDFIYTIRADSPIIGGPSAGAAAAILTISVLAGTPLKENTAITGTINSGGLIGPVGGLREKITAASKDSIKTVLVPQGEKEEINESNNTINIIDYGNDLNLTVVEVSDIYSAIKYFTDRQFKAQEENISISKEYKETMKKLALDLCNRTAELKSSIIINNASPEITSLYKDAINLSQKGEYAFKEDQFYSAASFCFGSNVKFNQAFLETKNFSEEKYSVLMEEVAKEIKKFDKEIDQKEIKTITDLESYMIVKERLIEAIEYTNSTKNASLSYSYSYSNERLRSAYSWAVFFNHEGKEFYFDDDSLKESCRQRIAESEERLQYASLYIPFRLDSPREELDKAYKDYDQGNYALCLFKASKSKAESNIILNTLGVESDYIPSLISNKLNAASRVIVKAEKKNMFPILGYSYYEYANNLKESDQFSALLYAEYALELSNIDVYFREKEIIKPIKIDYARLAIFFMGILLGFIIATIIYKRKKHSRKK